MRGYSEDFRNETVDVDERPLRPIVSVTREIFIPDVRISLKWRSRVLLCVILELFVDTFLTYLLTCEFYHKL